MTGKLTASQRHALKEAGEIDPFDPAHHHVEQNDPPAARLAEQHDQRDDKRPRLTHLGGSNSDVFYIALAEATRQTFWIAKETDHDQSLIIAGKALAGIAPADEIEGMLAAQMVAAHQASMECNRRAMLENQTIDGRAMNLKFAMKASATYATLLDALNKHRGKGQQKVTVEHVHVYEGGQAIVGRVEAPGGGAEEKTGGRPHAPRLTHSAQPLAPMWREDAERELVSVPCDAERAVPHARRIKSGRSSG